MRGIVVIRAGAGAQLSEAQLRHRLHGIGMRESLEDVPALLSSGGYNGTQDGEVAGALQGAEAA